MRKRFDTFAYLLLGCAALLPSCDDEPTQPAPAGLEEAPFVNMPPGSAFLDIAFSGTRGITVGAVASGLAPNQTFTPFMASLDSIGVWTPDSSVSLPTTGLLTALDMTPSGRAVIAGVNPSTGSGFILDERAGWSQYNVAIAGIGLASHEDTLRLAGFSATTQQMLISTAPGSWTPEMMPYPNGLGEKALQDVSEGGGLWVACGYNDGGEGTSESPNGVLFLNRGVFGWQRVSVSCGACSNWEFRAVGASETGDVLLGGAVTNFAGGANEYTASLLVWSVPGEMEWTQIALPSPTELRRVNDILVAEDGTVYLACGMGTAYLVRWSPGEPILRDATLPSARINRLAESPDGTIWAAGAVLDAHGSVVRAGIWKRPG